MIREKKCKGQGKAVSFIGCGKFTNVAFRRLGLCTSCYPKFLLETDAGKVIMQKALLKAQKPRLELEQATNEKKQLSALKQAHNHTKIVVHRYVRERDKGLNCISCDAPWKPDFQAGHFFKAELYETLKYHLDNINGQCVQCNIRKDGNYSEYSLRLPQRIGKERYNALVKLAEVDKQKSKVWDVQSLFTIQEEIKNLRK